MPLNSTNTRAYKKPCTSKHDNNKWIWWKLLSNSHPIQKYSNYTSTLEHHSIGLELDCSHGLAGTKVFWILHGLKRMTCLVITTMMLSLYSAVLIPIAGSQDGGAHWSQGSQGSSCHCERLPKHEWPCLKVGNMLCKETMRYRKCSTMDMLTVRIQIIGFCFIS